MNDHERRWIVVGPMAASAMRCFGHGYPLLAWNS